MDPSEYAVPAENYFHAGDHGPTVYVELRKVDNGYTIQLRTDPPRPPIRPEDFQGPYDGMDPDEIIDRMVDGLGAMVRTINDKGAGESWKDGDDRQQVREAFKIMFPQFARHAERIVRPPPEQPRQEHRVFETKKSLMDYLEKNL